MDAVGGFKEESATSESGDARGYLPRYCVQLLQNQRQPVNLETKKAPNAKVYPMHGAKRGKVLIFNHFTYDNSLKYKYRHGSKLDVQRLYEALPLLGFAEEDIILYENLTRNSIWRVAVELKYDRDLEETDCLMVVILTHGEEQDKVMARDNPYHLYEFIDNFTARWLPSMAGKPKIFLVQACRGSKFDLGAAMIDNSKPNDYDMDSEDSETEIFTYPESADLLIAMSSHHGKICHRK